MSHLFATADAVVTELNATSWSQSFTATRVLVSSVDWKSLDTLRVAVRAVSIEPKRLTRAKVSRKIELQIGVQKRLSAVSSATVDPLVALLEEIAEHFADVYLASRAGARVESSVAEPPYDEKHLAELKQFTGVVTLEISDLT